MLARRPLTILLAPLLAFVALSLPLLALASAAGIAGQEAALNPDGEAYEVNRDDGGNLWISDDGADEIWQVNPTTGAYTVYQGMSNAADARMDAAGMVWWTDASFEPRLGRISIGASTVTTWALPDAGLIWGLAFDSGGLVWTTDVTNGQVYSFEPASTRLCAYALPDDGSSDYVVARGTDIWLGDYWNARVVKLDPATNEFTSWQLLPGAFPRGLAPAENGDLWWADEILAQLARLGPGSNRVTAFPLLVGTSPEMITIEGGQVWYTEDGGGTVGRLDPAGAVGKTWVAAKTTTKVTPDCRDLGAGVTTSVSTRTGTLAWSQKTYAQIVSRGGWAVYQMPADASPWGIATSAGQVWVVDQGRRVLARLDPSASPSTQIYLPMIIRS